MAWSARWLSGLLMLATLLLSCSGNSIVGSPPPPAASCDAGTSSCSGVCVDLQSSATNCGACGTTCAATERCTAGACRAKCAAGQLACGVRCVDRLTDPANCGGCGVACAAGQVCSAGTCQGSCGAGLVNCSGSCRNLSNDRANCGLCGTACADALVCARGACAATCADGNANCSGTCRDLQSDRAHCGACGNTCVEGYSCQAGRCRIQCAELQVPCAAPGADAGPGGGAEMCVDTTTDIRNCGACANACPFGQFCVRGSCQTMCGAGFTNCSNVCRDLANDRENCGACGTVCPAGQLCSMGACLVSCGAGLANCSNVCRDLMTDRANCGTCGTTCAEGQVCAAGVCRISCGAGLTECTGMCRDLQTDRINCGACGTACADGQICNAGVCRVSCMTGSTDCAGVCRDLQSDLANCGACGTACGAGEVCTMGACRTSCMTGQVLCAGLCTSTQFDPTNCGTCGTRCGPYANAMATCTAGSCVQVCAAGFDDCNTDRADGCERNLNADLTHCGRCGNACPPRANATINCAAGVCGFTCEANFADCDGNPNNGCEVDLRTTVGNCGRCGNACSVANGTAACVAGACAVASCTAPFRDCDMRPTNGCENDTRITCGGCDLGCRDRTVGGTGGAPYDATGQRGTAVDPARGGLVVSGMSMTTTLDFLWVVNTAESTVGKWDATGQREVARYRVGLASGECRGLCCYNNGCNMPSRVVVDGNGDAYVASRGFGTQGSVTKLAAERSNCVDRNGNGVIDTSSSPTDVRAYGADECVLWTSNVGTPDAVLRAITTDRGDATNPFGYVWVGGYNTSRAYRLNPRTGATLGTYTLAVAPYAMVVTSDGRLWVSTLNQALLQSINTTTLTVGPTVAYPTTRRLGNCPNAYGMTADGRGRLWLAGWDCRDALGYDPATNTWTRVDTTSLVGGTAGRGITVDASARVWMNYATTSDTTSGGLLNWDSNAFVGGGTIPATAVTRVPLPGGFTGPSGLGVDRVGNVWAAHYLAPSPLVRYTPSTNSSVVLYGPNQVYSYSDFTGSVRRTTIAQGTYEETVDLGCDAPVFTNFTWAATTPAGTSISFAARTATTAVGLGAASSVTVALAPRDTSPVSLAAAFSGASIAPARQLRLAISMQSSEGGATPILNSFNVGWRCPAP